MDGAYITKEKVMKEECSTKKDVMDRACSSKEKVMNKACSAKEEVMSGACSTKKEEINGTCSFYSRAEKWHKGLRHLEDLNTDDSTILNCIIK